MWLEYLIGFVWFGLGYLFMFGGFLVFCTVIYAVVYFFCIAMGYIEEII